MRVLVTGSNGFIGKNLMVRLGELSKFTVVGLDRSDAPSALREKVGDADAVVHLAGVNRPTDPLEFETGNARLTAEVCSAIELTGRRILLLLASSIQAEMDNAYGRSKLAAERVAEDLAARTGTPVVIYRFPNVFGKWCRPGYNSAVATFCYNVANDLPIRVDDPTVSLRLVHVDDVVTSIIEALVGTGDGVSQRVVTPEYRTTVGELASQIEAFRHCRQSLVIERVGAGLPRALYSTYVSYLPTGKFTYQLPSHDDARGTFVEMLKTVDSGQFSFFTAHPGITRGGHYHHAKTEKFVVIKGRARFRFRHILTGERQTVEMSGDQPTVVETIPGWAHDITNTGEGELVVMLWANEVFDRARPDTIGSAV